MTFAQTLRQLRYDARLTQSQAASLCSVGVRTWQRWEAEPKPGKKPTLPSEPAKRDIKNALVRVIYDDKQTNRETSAPVGNAGK